MRAGFSRTSEAAFFLTDKNTHQHARTHTNAKSKEKSVEYQTRPHRVRSSLNAKKVRETWAVTRSNIVRGIRSHSFAAALIHSTPIHWKTHDFRNDVENWHWHYGFVTASHKNPIKLCWESLWPHFAESTKANLQYRKMSGTSSFSQCITMQTHLPLHISRYPSQSAAVL